MSTDFPAYAPTEEHELLRQTVRELAAAKIGPVASEVDEAARFPQEALDALVQADLHAVHIPEAYGGAGADALATVIVIEEVARACASSALIPAVNKLGTVPVLLSGSEDLKKRYLTPMARGEALFSYALSEAGAGYRRRRHDDQGDPRRRSLGAERHQDVDHERGRVGVLHGDGGHGPGGGSRGISAFVVEKSDPGVSFGAPEKKLGIKGSPTRAVILEDVRIPADRIIGAEGTGFTTALATLDHTRITIAAQALGIAQGAVDHAIGYVKERRQFGKAIAEFQGVQFMLADMGMKLEAARQLTYHAAVKSELRENRRPDLRRRGGQVLRLRRGHGDHHRRGAAPRRVRLHEGLPGRADDARREDHPDLRRHEPDPARRHGAMAAG